MIRTFSYIALLFLLTASAITDGREANKAYESGDYKQAEQLYLSAIEQDPDNAKLYFNLGNAQAKQGKVEDAIQSYMEFRGLAESPEDKAKAEYNIGTLLTQGQKWKPAAAHFKNALKLNPNDLDAKHNYEQALAKQQEQEEEQEGQDQNQQNQPPPEPSEYALAMKEQAEKLVAQRKYAEAYNLMQRALDADDTVRAFNDFIERIKNVSDIDSN
ncbi:MULTISPECIES: tetratricopeptide repeat protein [Gracilimonas]|uniref:Tetratricopeptide repeat protein n=1 Tax=Gracilimonas sediminicola TaxID=2952158 RepID=A0A9X2RF97_9BACT|nr:tetratricopeptide repeat protein [Gracilimonas sediminicola]MCP9291582.1 tetratricopeptide repeat protein [Gracilimonas sediminicola]